MTAVPGIPVSPRTSLPATTVTVASTDFVPMRQAVTNRAKGTTPGNSLWLTVRLPVLVHLHQVSSSVAGDPALAPGSVSSGTFNCARQK